MSLVKRIDIIGVKNDLGAGAKGMGLGPEVMRLTGLVEKLTDLGISVHDMSDLTHRKGLKNKDTGENLKNLAQINRINKRLYKHVWLSLTLGFFPLTLGGDHSLAAGSVCAVQEHYKNIGVIWVDAHGDFNDNFSSPTGNIHGMPLSAVTGNGPNQILPFRQLTDDFVNAKNTVIIGGRDFDTEEARRIQRAGVTVFTAEDVAREGMDTVMKKALAVALKGTAGVYLSFDIDALDPSVAPGVGTPVDGGLSLESGKALCAAIAKSGKLLGAEFVELDPILDEKNKSGIAAVELITSLFSCLKS